MGAIVDAFYIESQIGITAGVMGNAPGDFPAAFVADVANAEYGAGKLFIDPGCAVVDKFNHLVGAKACVAGAMSFDDGIVRAGESEFCGIENAAVTWLAEGLGAGKGAIVIEDFAEAEGILRGFPPADDASGGRGEGGIDGDVCRKQGRSKIDDNRRFA